MRKEKGTRCPSALKSLSFPFPEVEHSDYGDYSSTVIILSARGFWCYEYERNS